MAATYILSAIVALQLVLIWGLVNRLIRQSGQRPISVSESVKDALEMPRKPGTAKVEHPRIKAGSQRISV